MVDIFRGEEGLRSQTELMNALAAHARQDGRPAVLLAALMPQPMRDQLRLQGLPELADNADFFSAALAVGDGLDLGVVVGYRTMPAASEAVRSLQQRTQELRRRPALVFIGLANFLEPLQLVAAPRNARRNQPELHVAYRLPGDELAQLLSRVARPSNRWIWGDWRIGHDWRHPSPLTLPWLPRCGSRAGGVASAHRR